MNKRFFQLCPPSFPEHYSITKTDKGWMYASKYISPMGTSTFLTAVNEWFDFLGDITMEINADLEKLEQDMRKEARGKIRDNPRVNISSRKPKLKVERRINQS